MFLHAPATRLCCTTCALCVATFKQWLSTNSSWMDKMYQDYRKTELLEVYVWAIALCSASTSFHIYPLPFLFEGIWGSRAEKGHSLRTQSDTGSHSTQYISFIPAVRATSWLVSVFGSRMDNLKSLQLLLNCNSHYPWPLARLVGADGSPTTSGAP